VQVQCPSVVAEAVPQPDHLRCGGFGTLAGGRESGDELRVARDHTVDLGLLQHHFGHVDTPGVPGCSPRQVSEVVRGPRRQQLLNALDLEWSHRRYRC